MHALIYLSKAAKPFTHEEVVELATKASIYNKTIEVSGFLTFRRSYFVQFLEGKKDDVLGLYAKIEKDPRHQLLKTVHVSEPERYNFGEWNMRYISTDEEIRAIPDDLLIDVLHRIDLENDSPHLVKAEIYTIVNRINRILYLPRLK